MASKRRPPPVVDPIDRAIAAQKEAQARFVRQVCALVPYEMFLEVKPALKIMTFEELRTAAMLDLFFDLSDEEVARKLTVKEWRLQNLREHAHYGAVRDALAEQAKKLAGSLTMDALAEVAERAVASERLSTALDPGGDARERNRAQDAFLDRRSSKKGRESEGGAVLVLPEGLLEMLRAAREIEAARNVGRQEVIIDATVLQIPSKTGEHLD